GGACDTLYDQGETLMHHVPGYTYDPVLERYVPTRAHAASAPRTATMGAALASTIIDETRTLHREMMQLDNDLQATIKQGATGPAGKPDFRDWYAAWVLFKQEVSAFVKDSTSWTATMMDPLLGTRYDRLVDLRKRMEVWRTQARARGVVLHAPDPAPPKQPTDWGGAALKLGIGAGAFWLLLDLIKSRRGVVAAA
ncbi:MAG: hypothetical protein Q8S13_02735, partial [Dehalococcoidia bacterium]|nr:hypothetical protein [Dehalococcoidia bacterium]